MHSSILPRRVKYFPVCSNPPTCQQHQHQTKKKNRWVVEKAVTGCQDLKRGHVLIFFSNGCFPECFHACYELFYISVVPLSLSSRVPIYISSPQNDANGDEDNDTINQFGSIVTVSYTYIICIVSTLRRKKGERLSLVGWRK